MHISSKLLLIALAGGLGAVSRYSMAGWVQAATGRVFPWGTVAVNLVGCLLFGILTGLFENRLAISAETRAILLTGFMGAFTTFSTYMFETQQLLADDQWLAAGANLTLQNLVGFVAIVVGLAIGRLV